MHFTKLVWKGFSYEMYWQNPPKLLSKTHLIWQARVGENDLKHLRFTTKTRVILLSLLDSYTCHLFT